VIALSFEISTILNILVIVLLVRNLPLAALTAAAEVQHNASGYRMWWTLLPRGIYVMVYAHRGSTTWLDPTVANTNLTIMEGKFYHLWYQIGTKFGCKSHLLAFEAVNEPSGSSSLDAAF